MAHPNPLNVYKGRDSMIKYYDPDLQPLLPLIELPDKMNPFRDDNVRIYAKMMTAHPAQNVKAFPALNMLLHDPEGGKKSIIEPSSGSTVMSLRLISRILYNNDDTRAYVSNKTEINRLRQLQFWGLKVELYGGPAQPEVTDPRGPICKSQQLAKENERLWNPGQYISEHNWASHVRWTGPQLWKQLPEINVFAMGMGSGGCVTGTGTYLKSQKPSVTVLGVCNAVGDAIPGPRPFQLLDSCGFPWRKAVDTVESIGSVDSYRLSLQLCREGLICGPSSGMNLKGLFNFLQNAKNAGKLHEYAERDTGEISCVFICCDLPQQYLDGYFERLGEDEFHPITNRSLLSIDTDVYDLKWELSPQQATATLYGKEARNHPKPLCSKSACRNNPSTSPFASSNITLLDLRSSPDFDRGHICGAISLPLRGLTAESGSPFDDLDTLQQQWKDLKDTFGGDELPRGLNAASGPMVVLCYSGESARLATAVMRARGLEAYSVKGGIQALLR